MMNASLAMTLTLALALLANLGVKLWLATRQARHVAQHQHQVPAAFVGTISLQAHQKAAQYTLAKSRLGLWDMALETLVLLGWTLLGGLDWLHQSLIAWLGTGMTQQLALVVAFMLIGGLIHLPLSLLQTFGVEQRFGFNRMTWRLFVADLLKQAVLFAIIGLPLARDADDPRARIELRYAARLQVFYQFGNSEQADDIIHLCPFFPFVLSQHPFASH